MSLPLRSFRGQCDFASGFYCNLISGFVSCDRIMICFLKTETDLPNAIICYCCLFSLTAKSLACVADETKPRYSPSANQRPKACSAPRVLPGFSIIGSNWRLHMAVLSCTGIGRVDNVEPWLRVSMNTRYTKQIRRRSRNYLRGVIKYKVLLKCCSELLT